MMDAEKKAEVAKRLVDWAETSMSSESSDAIGADLYAKILGKIQAILDSGDNEWAQLCLQEAKKRGAGIYDNLRDSFDMMAEEIPPKRLSGIRTRVGHEYDLVAIAVAVIGGDDERDDSMRSVLRLDDAYAKSGLTRYRYSTLQDGVLFDPVLYYPEALGEIGPATKREIAHELAREIIMGQPFEAGPGIAELRKKNMRYCHHGSGREGGHRGCVRVLIGAVASSLDDDPPPGGELLSIDTEALGRELSRHVLNGKEKTRLMVIDVGTLSEAMDCCRPVAA